VCSGDGLTAATCCAVRHGTDLYRFIDLKKRNVSLVGNCLQTGNRNRAKVRRETKRLVLYLRVFIWNLPQPYLVKVGY
jgi:hypothetical protein